MFFTHLGYGKEVAFAELEAVGRRFFSVLADERFVEISLLTNDSFVVPARLVDHGEVVIPQLQNFRELAIAFLGDIGLVTVTCLHCLRFVICGQGKRAQSQH